jgi:hypothetical protein
MDQARRMRDRTVQERMVEVVYGTNGVTNQMRWCAHSFHWMMSTVRLDVWTAEVDKDVRRLGRRSRSREWDVTPPDPACMHLLLNFVSISLWQLTART